MILRILKYFSFVVLTIVILFVTTTLIAYLLSDSVVQKQYRYKIASSDRDCVINLVTDNAKKSDILSAEECIVQTILLPNENTPNNKNSYKLAYLELNESGKLYQNNQQLREILNLLNNKNEKLLTVFVHGWRHDSEIGNKDVHRFRTLLAYSRKFLNERDYGKKELIGIFVGWRGRQIVEPENKIFSTLAALPTFWSRKTLSDNLGAPVYSYLKEISNSLKKNNSNNKMLTIGHSMGGNILITGMQDDIIKKIDDYRTKAGNKGEEFPHVLGDLVTLINPAAEASKWIEIQEELRRYDNKKGNDVVEKINPYDKIPNYSDYFPKTQKPILVSLTATSSWPVNEIVPEKNSLCKSIKDSFIDKKGKVSSLGEWAMNLPYLCIAHDFATKEIFTLAQTLSLNFNHRHRIAIGHYIPSNVSLLALTKLQNYGTTHELILNNSSEVRTNLKNLDISNCKIIDGALLKIRKLTSSSWGRWDSNEFHIDTGKIKEAHLPFDFAPDKGKGKTSLHNQIRRGLSLATKGSSTSTIMPANTPFWNVRVKNSIAYHGEFINYPTWCLLNQFVLDDITSP